MTGALAAVIAVAGLVGPLLFVLIDDRPRPVKPPALAGDRTGVERAELPQARPLPRSPMVPVRAATPEVARTGPATRVGVTGRQTATPTRHQAVGHG